MVVTLQRKYHVMGDFEMERDFSSFLSMHEQRIYYQIQRLGIPYGLQEEFYAEGILALWHAYKHHDETKGEIGTFINYQIRFRLIDLIRKNKQDEKVKEETLKGRTIELEDGNRSSTSTTPLLRTEGIILENEAFWEEVKKDLTDKQWKWVHYFIIADLTIQEIMEIENVSADAVKGWAKEVRRKLKNEEIYEKLTNLLD